MNFFTFCRCLWIGKMVDELSGGNQRLRTKPEDADIARIRAKYLQDQPAQNKQTILEIHGRIVTGKLNAGSKLLAVGESAGGVKLYDTSSGKPLHYFDKHMPYLADRMVFSQDGSKLVAAYRNSFIIVWDTRNGSLISEFSFSKPNGTYFTKNMPGCPVVLTRG